MISNDPIFFVAGCAHSGTTLLTAILDSHPDLFAIKRETTWFSNFGVNYGLIREQFFAEQEKMRNNDKKFIVEKTANHVNNIPLIRQFFPNAKFILITRHPLDNCTSLYIRSSNIELAINRWVTANHFVITHSADSDVHVISYEELTASPVDAIKKIVKFMDISYDKDMLDFFKKDIKFDGNDVVTVKRNSQIKFPISYKTYRNQQIFTPKQVDFVLSYTKELAKQLKYYS